ncbi:CDP-glycerol glycerophosphotransferase family protein [Chloroflexota bacterium]
MKDLIIYSNRKQRVAIESFLRKSTDIPTIIRTDTKLFLNGLYRELKILDLPKGDFNEAAEKARNVFNYLYDINIQGKTVFRDVLTLEAYPILKIWETTFVNNYLCSLFKILMPLVKVVEQYNPRRIHVFRPYGISEKLSLTIFPSKFKAQAKAINQPFHIGIPAINILGFELRIHRFFYQIGSILLPKVRSFKYKRSATVGNQDLSNRRKVCFFSVNKKMVDVLIPIVKRLEKDHQLASIVIDWGSNATDELGKHGIPWYNFYSYLDARIAYNQHKLAKSISKSWNEIKATMPELNEIFIDGYNVSPIVISVLDRIYLYDIFLSIRDFLITKTLVRKLAVAAIFVTNERESKAKACIYGGKACGIRTYNCQRGIIADHPEVSSITTDKMFVNGAFYKNNLVKRGVDHNKVFITGNPRFDILYDKLSNSKEIKQKLYKTLKINDAEVLSVIFTQPTSLGVTEEDKVRLVRGGLIAVKNIKGIRPIIKLHPSQGDSRIEREIASQLNMDNVLFLKEGVDLYDLLISSKFLIMDMTTVGLDAIILGKPIIMTRFRKRDSNNMDYIDLGVAMDGKSEQEVKKLAKQIMVDNNTIKQYYENRKLFIRDHMYKFDGKSSERVISIIRKDLIK